jgi:hypothetical protein
MVTLSVSVPAKKIQQRLNASDRLATRHPTIVVWPSRRSRVSFRRRDETHCVSRAPSPTPEVVAVVFSDPVKTDRGV